MITRSVTESLKRNVFVSYLGARTCTNSSSATNKPAVKTRINRVISRPVIQRPSIALRTSRFFKRYEDRFSKYMLVYMGFVSMSGVIFWFLYHIWASWARTKEENHLASCLQKEIVYKRATTGEGIDIPLVAKDQTNLQHKQNMNNLDIILQEDANEEFENI